MQDDENVTYDVNEILDVRNYVETERDDDRTQIQKVDYLVRWEGPDR